MGGNEAKGGASASERRVAAVVSGALKAAHDHAASAPIAGPDEQGAFPPAWRPGPLGGVVPPVVVDANVLRNDVRYSCEHGRRTVLLTAANAGAIRLFGASHVVEEILEHAEEWAKEWGVVSAAEFRERFRAEYLPLIRVIADEELSGDLLSPAELVRIAWLEVRDPDDVPSATLALALEAFFLSEDSRPLRAVYGESVDQAAHHAWVERLKAGGDAGELGKLVFAAGAVPMAAGAGLFEAGRWIARRHSPWALAPIGVAIATLLYLRPPSPETRARIGTAISKYVLAVGHAYVRYLDAYKEFADATPAVPDLTAATGSGSGDGLLRRAVMHRLARTPGGRLSPAELARGIEQSGEAVIEDLLSGSGCFSEPYRESWQLGAYRREDEPPRQLATAAVERPAMAFPGTPTPQRLRAAGHPLPWPHGVPSRRR